MIYLIYVLFFPNSSFGVLSEYLKNCLRFTARLSSSHGYLAT
jgi:hypothetical protein